MAQVIGSKQPGRRAERPWGKIADFKSNASGVSCFLTNSFLQTLVCQTWLCEVYMWDVFRHSLKDLSSQAV